MTVDSDQRPAARWLTAALIGVALGGLALRLAGLFGPGGPLASPTDYDDAVYYAASALLFRGVLPYRDFVFVHPPGVLYFFGLVSGLPFDAASGFIAARFIAAMVGGVNTFLAGRIAGRGAGPIAAITAAFLYAIYPNAVVAERSPYLEPVLNLMCLSMALVWLSPRDGRSRRAWSAGILGGAACATKVLGGIWIVAAIASSRAGRFRSDAARFVAAASITGVVLLAPLALTNLSGFVRQTLFFHSARPADGTLDRMVRLREMFASGHSVASVLAIAALISMLVTIVRFGPSRLTVEERFFGVAGPLTVLAFAASSSYWASYNSHLAPSQCVLAGLGAAAITRIGEERNRRVASSVVLAAVVLFSISSIRTVVGESRGRDPQLIATGAGIRKAVPPDACVFAFDPAWTLAGGRLPPSGDGAPVIVDSYGAMLLRAVGGGAKYPDTDTAFRRAAPHPDVRARLESCRYAILGWRGNWQLDAETRAWFSSHYICTDSSAGSLCVMQRLDHPLTSLAVTSDAGRVEFGDGWFEQEGDGASGWRWMGAHSRTTLPQISGTAWLQLTFHVPLQSLGGSPAVTVTLDGRTLDRIEAREGEITRSYRVEVAPGDRHELLLSTSRTFSPARSGASADSRELGISVKRIIWVPLENGRPRLPDSRP